MPRHNWQMGIWTSMTCPGNNFAQIIFLLAVKIISGIHCLQLSVHYNFQQID